MRQKIWIQSISIIAVLFAVLGCTTAGNSAASAAVTPEPVKSAPVEPKTVIVKVPQIQSETSYIHEDILESKKTYTYENDRLTNVDVTDSFGEPIEFITYEYDGGSKPVKKFVYDPKQKLQSMRQYEYGDDGNVVQEQVFNRDEELQTVSEYQYDADGNLVRWNVKDGSGALLAYTEYRYENGKNVRIDTYSADGVLRDYFIREFSGGLLSVEKKFDENEKPAGRVEYSYENGLLTLEKHYRANGSLERSISYEHDQEGSITRETYKRADDKVEQVIVREYTYREEERVSE